MNAKLRTTVFALLFVFSIVLTSCGSGGEPPHPCEPRDNDPNGYMIRICEYLNEAQLNLGTPWKTINMLSNQEEEREGRRVIVVRMDCCGMGDRAIIDKETGEVLDYSLGNY